VLIAEDTVMRLSVKNVFFFILLSTIANASDLPSDPKPDTSVVFRRSGDLMFGLLVGEPVGLATRPWIGLAAGVGAGVADEARYGSHFNVGHLAIISAGSLVGYEINRWQRKHRHSRRARRTSFQQEAQGMSAD